MADLVRLYERIEDMERRLAALEAAAKPPDDPYELAAHWRDKHGELRNELERVERHDRAMAEEVVRLRKELDKAELARDANQAAADTLERVRSDRDEWRAKAEAHQQAADVLERLRRGEQITTTDCDGNTVALVETSYLAEKTRAMDALKAERDAIAAKLADREAVIDQLQYRLANLERRLAERDRDAERWRQWLKAQSSTDAFVKVLDAAISAEKEEK